MRNVFIGIAAVLVVIAAIAPLLIAFFIPDWIPGMQAVAVAYVSAFACVGAILFIVLVGLLALIAFQLKNNVVPLLEKATDTMHTVQGTTTFVSESVVQPIIKTAGAVAGARAMVQTLMRRQGGTDTTGNGR
ncbi:MAG TPA: hypothetical protein VF276_14820 [Chloroflexia bacterium]|jgi:hypothetical protein|nr:hypothetical protein [Chloroflexia bacterium]